MSASPQAKAEAGGSECALWLLVVLLPVLFWLSGACVNHHLDGQYQDAVRQRLGSKAAQVIRTYPTAQAACARQLLDEDWCMLVTLSTIVRRGGVIGGLVSIGLLVVVANRARHAQRDPTQLPRLFRQAVLLTSLTAAGLGLGYAVLFGIVVALVPMVFFSLFFGRLALGVLIVSGLAALRAAKLALTWGTPLSQREPFAVALSRVDAPALWRLVDTVAQHVGTAAPDQLLLTLEPNCYAVEVPVQIPSRIVHGRTLCLSLPLLRVWSADELAAVVGHELAHFHGADTRYAREFAPALQGALTALGHLRQTISHDVRALAILPCIPLFTFTAGHFVLASAHYSRQRELRADALAAQVAGARAIATALVKVSVAAVAWEQYAGMLVTGKGENLPPVSTALAVCVAGELSQPAPPAWVAAEHVGHPVDRHPPLSQRLQALGLTLHDVWRQASLPAQPASLLVPAYPVIEHQLTTQLVQLLGLTRNANAAGTPPPPPTA